MLECAWPDTVDGWDPPDLEAVGKLFATAVGRRLFEHFSMRGTDASERCLVEEVALKTATSKTDVIAFFRALYEAQIGDFILGRKGRETRFTWRCRPDEILAAAIARRYIVVAGQSLAVVADNSSGDDELVEHSFRLRSDLIVTLKLPASLTSREARRLARFVRALPLES
jgi:hypothetical protein